MDKTRQLGQKMLVTLKEIPRRFPKTAAALSEAPDDILSIVVKTFTESAKTLIQSKISVAVGAESIGAIADSAKISADPPNTVHDNVTVTSAATPCLEITKEGSLRVYDKELARALGEKAIKATIAKFPHVQAAIKDVENGSINLLIELTYVSQPAATSPTTATTSDNSLDWASIVEDFANSFAQAFYEEGCKQSLFDPIDYEAECEIELNSEVAQTKMLMIKKGWSVLLASCFLGYVEIVGSLLSDSSMDVNEVDEE
eukprot:gene11580-12971_t